MRMATVLLLALLPVRLFELEYRKKIPCQFPVALLAVMVLL